MKHPAENTSDLHLSKTHTAESVNIDPFSPPKEEKHPANSPESYRVHHSESSQSPKEKNTIALVVGGIIIGIFILVIGGFALYNHYNPAPQTIDDLHALNLQGELSPEEGYIYNGYSFVKSDGLWWSEIQDDGRTVKFPLHFGPLEVQDIPIHGGLSPQFENGSEIFIAIDPTIENKYYTLAISEMSINIAKGIARMPVGACTQEDPICENRTIINCDTAAGKPVIEFAVSNITQVTLRDTCIRIEGNDYDLTKAVDRLLYHWYNVVEKR
ncbi:hypothetical protein HYV86_06640 [Candidatus Woesearchaeota archaeon]|nr:hypothetical protein [Candidatus Woesearchaeota archaeon]